MVITGIAVLDTPARPFMPLFMPGALTNTSVVADP
jgi:hypothetical protein